MTRSLIPNSTQVPDIILDEWMPHLSGAELAIVLAVARKTFGWGKSFDRIGTAQMIELTGLARRAIQMACDSLGAVGILAIRVAGDGVTANAYKLNMDAPDSVLAALTTRTDAAKSKSATAAQKSSEIDGGGAKNAPGAKNALVQKKTIGGAKNAPGGAQKMRPSRDTLRNTIQETHTEQVCVRFSPADFAEFWQAYPHKQAKDDACKAWRKLNPDTALREIMLSAIAKAKECSQWQRGIIPNPATWLNGRRWCDELSPPPGLNPPGFGPPARKPEYELRYDEESKAFIKQRVKADVPTAESITQ